MDENTSRYNNELQSIMNNNKPTLEEFCRIYPELLAQAREYAEGTIVDPEEHDDAVESCICDFMEGVRAAMFYKANLQGRS